MCSSNHYALIMSLAQNGFKACSSRLRPTRLEPWWLHQPDCHELIKSAWRPTLLSTLTSIMDDFGQSQIPVVYLELSKFWGYPKRNQQASERAGLFGGCRK